MAKKPHRVPAPPLTTAYAVAVLGWLLSAGVYIAAKWVAPEMPPWALCFWRLALACAILLPIVRHHYGGDGRACPVAAAASCWPSAPSA